MAWQPELRTYLVQTKAVLGILLQKLGDQVLRIVANVLQANKKAQMLHVYTRCQVYK